MSLLRRWLAAARGAGEPAVPRGDPERVAEVQRILDGLAGALAADGGSIELLAVEEGRVRVRLRGACAACHSSDLTLSGALEPRLRAELAWFEELRSE